jgi:hypothetical protein
MTPDSLSDEREAFEDALRSLVGVVGVTVAFKWKNGRYIADFTQLHWLMWQKARAI